MRAFFGKGLQVWVRDRGATGLWSPWVQCFKANNMRSTQICSRCISIRYCSRQRELERLPKTGCYSTNEYHVIIDFHTAALLVEPGLMYSVIRKMWLYLCVMYMYLHYVPERAVAALRFVVRGSLAYRYPNNRKTSRQVPGCALTPDAIGLRLHSLTLRLISSHLIPSYFISSSSTSFNSST